MNRKVWVIGKYGTNADREFGWDSSTIPHLADADVLILDLTSLNQITFEKMARTNYLQIRDATHDKFLNGGIVIFITKEYFKFDKSFYTYSNYDFSPIDLTTHSVGKGEEIIFREHSRSENPFLSYLENVKSFNFYLEKFSSSSINSRLQKLKTAHKIVYYQNREITDKDNHVLSRTYVIVNDNLDDHGEYGSITFLPPTTEILVVEGIKKLIQNLKSHAQDEKETPPEWVTRIPIHGIDMKIAELEKLNKDKEDLENKIQVTETEKQDLINHTQLLYSNGKHLEQSVFTAFKLLGIDNITKIREEDLEDWVFEFNNVKDFAYGIMEVKGSENRTSLANLTQCNKWVEDYLIESKKAKGIFVTNQHRLDEYPNSRQKKMHFEPNEIDYAKTRQICIIPSYVLFEAVNKALEGKVKSRAEIEKLIAETNGILTEL